jgi:DNA replication protein DnaC
MSSQLAQLQEATIKQHCKTLRMPMMASQFSTLAEQAVREKKTHTGYLEVLLTTAEIEERERNTIDRRIKEAHLPRVKTLEEFDYTQAPLVTATKMRDLAGRLHRASRTSLLIGDRGTGKTHLLTGLCVATCRQGRVATADTVSFSALIRHFAGRQLRAGQLRTK